MTVGTPAGYTMTSSGLKPTGIAQAEARYAASHPSGSSSIKHVSGSSGHVTGSGASGVRPVSDSGSEYENKMAETGGGTVLPIRQSNAVSTVKSVSGSSISPIAGLFNKHSPIGRMISKVVSQHSSDVGSSPTASSVLSSLTGTVPAGQKWTEAAALGRGNVEYYTVDGQRMTKFTDNQGHVSIYSPEQQSSPWTGGANALNPLNPNYENATGRTVPYTFAQAGGESSFRSILQEKYPHLNSEKIDNLMDVQRVKEGTLSASSVFGAPEGMDPKVYDLAEAQIFGSMGYSAPLSHSEEVAAFNIATGVNNANSPAYQSALADDLSKGFDVQNYSHFGGLTQAQISTDAASRLAAGQNVKELTPSYNNFRSEYRQANPRNISGLQNNWYAYNKGWITREEALGGVATHMPTVGIPSKHPTEAYIPPGYNWDPELGIMTRPNIEVGQASGGGLQELEEYDNGIKYTSDDIASGVSTIASEED